MRRRALPILASLAGVALVGLLVYGVTAQSANRTIDEQVAGGGSAAAPAATRELPLLGGGGSRSLASLRGEVVVLNFWASWCEPCQLEAPLLEHAQGVLARSRATVLGVTYLDASPDSRSFARRFHLTYPSVRDTTGSFAHAYGTNQLPESFIVDRRGRIVAVSRGEIGESFIRRAVALAQGT